MTDLQHQATATAPAAGWYPDPAEPGRSRWWSGEAWTDHVQPAQPADPAMPASVGVPVEPAIASASRS